MARYNPWKGKKVGDLLNISPSRLSEMASRELRSLVTRISSAANKRIRSFESRGIPTQTQRFTAKGKTDNELIGEYNRLVRFMDDPTTTVKGYREFRERIETEAQEVFDEGFEEEWGDEWNEMFWDLYQHWSEVAKGKGLTHYEIVMLVGQAMTRSTSRERLDTLVRDAIESEYKKQEGARADYDRAASNRIGGLFRS